MTIHIEGMGLTGSLLAHMLAARGAKFTWHDIEAPHTAWQASTGAIYPSGSHKFGPDMQCYDVWAKWYEDGLFARDHLEQSAYVFCTKNPPHEGKYEHMEIADAPGLRLAHVPSYHFNAQSFVTYTRKRFAACRTPDTASQIPFGADNYIVAHSWGLRLDRTYWGWTRLVELEYPSCLSPSRPAFYFRPNRFQMAYAYPVPGTRLWYAGSSIIQQRLGKLRSLDMVSKYDKWESLFHELSGGAVKVVRRGDFLQGWRPAAAKDDEAWLRKKGNVLSVRPLWNSGIRHFPKQWWQLAEQLKLAP